MHPWPRINILFCLPCGRRYRMRYQSLRFSVEAMWIKVITAHCGLAELRDHAWSSGMREKMRDNHAKCVTGGNPWCDGKVFKRAFLLHNYCDLLLKSDWKNAALFYWLCIFFPGMNLFLAFFLLLKLLAGQTPASSKHTAYRSVRQLTR